MATKLILAQVTTRVVNPGDPIAYAGRPDDPTPEGPGVGLYQLQVNAGTAPPVGFLWHTPGGSSFKINATDKVGTDCEAAIQLIKAGDQVVINRVAYGISGPASLSSPEVYTIPLSGPQSLPSGTYEIYIIQA